MRVGALQVESLSCQGVHELNRILPATERDLLEGIPCALVDRIQKSLVGGWCDFADPVMRQAFVIVSNKVRIFLLVAIGDLRRCGNLGFLLRGVEADLERSGGSFIRSTGRALGLRRLRV